MCVHACAFIQASLVSCTCEVLHWHGETKQLSNSKLILRNKPVENPGTAFRHHRPLPPVILGLVRQLKAWLGTKLHAHPRSVGDSRCLRPFLRTKNPIGFPFLSTPQTRRKSGAVSKAWKQSCLVGWVALNKRQWEGLSLTASNPPAPCSAHRSHVIPRRLTFALALSL